MVIGVPVSFAAREVALGERGGRFLIAHVVGLPDAEE